MIIGQYGEFADHFLTYSISMICNQKLVQKNDK